MGKALQWGADGRPEEGSYPVSLPGYLAGSGLDGSLTVSGTTTLTRDSFYTTLTIQTGGRLNTAGFRVFARKIVIQGTGKMAADGTDGGVVNMWDPAVLQAAGTISLGCTAGGSGANNGATFPLGQNGITPTTIGNGCGGVGGSGGAGGANNVPNAGGAGGTGSVITLTEYFARPTRDFLRMATGVRGGSAAGSGGGGADVSQFYSGTSGGSAGGGNILAFWCEELDISTAQAGALSAKGGTSQVSQTGVGTNCGGAGGSGGGGGGYIHGEIGFVTGTVAGVANADGTAGRNGSAGTGGGKGGQGGQGGAGGNIDIYVAAIGTWYSARGTAGGALGSVPSTTTGSTGGAAGTCSVTL